MSTAHFSDTWLAPAIALSFAAVLLAIGAAVLYRGVAPAALERLNAGSGEIRMGEAQRLEEAGARLSAIEVYKSALPLAFAGAYNRAHVLKRIGTLLVLEERFEESLPYLYEAVDHPGGDSKGYDALCAALYHLGRWDDTKAAARKGLVLAEQENYVKGQTLAWFYLAMAEKGQGNIDSAEAYFRESISLDPGQQSDAELAEILFNSGRHKEALLHANAYLQAGGSGKQRAEMRLLVQAIEASGSSTQ